MTATPDTIFPATRMLETVRLSGATDPEGDPILMHINAVSQDEPVSGTGFGDPTLPDAHFTAAGADSNDVEVRDEQSPLGDGRVYHVAFTVTDAHGASCVGDSTVAVPRAPIQPAVDSAPARFHSFTGAPSPSRARMDAEGRDLGVHTARADHPRETDHRAAFIAPGATCIAPLLDERWRCRQRLEARSIVRQP